jgi:hypothetical protein
MSVIYDTLKKLESGAVESPSKSAAAKRQHNVYSLRQIIFSPMAMVLILLILLLAGWMLMGGLPLLKGWLGIAAAPPTVNAQVDPPLHPISTQPSRKETAASPDGSPVPDPALPPPPRLTEEVLRPRAEEPVESMPGTEPVHDQAAANMRYLTPHSNAGDSAGTGGDGGAPEGHGRSPVTGGGLNDLMPAGSPPMSADAGLRGESLNQGHVAANPMMVLAHAGDGVAAVDRVNTELEPAPLENSEGPETFGSPPAAGEHHRAASRRVLRISRLVAEIQAAINRHDSGQIAALLDELATAKGANDPYTLKLTAYWKIVQHEDSEAVRILSQVLQSAPDDLEAGLNMAIVELRRGDRKAAGRRIARLERLYPDHDGLLVLKDQLYGGGTHPNP